MKRITVFIRGYTKDLRRRVREHMQGLVTSTKMRRPLKLVYYEACLFKRDAERRERFLKTSLGKARLKKHLKVCFESRSRPG